MNITLPMIFNLQLDSRQWIFEHDLRILNDHIVTVEQQLSERRESILDLMTKELSNRYPSGIEPAGGEFDEELWKSHDLLPTIHRHSSLLMLFSYFESFFDGICENVASITSSPRTRKYDHLDGAIEYLKDCTGIDLTKLDQWSAIRLAREIRNHIAHDNGRLVDGNAKSEALRLEIIKSQDLSLGNRNKIQLSVSYLLNLLIIMQSFSQNAVKAIMQQ